ncbi:MAG: hypothetical protein OJF51_003378 [Nitrospira sp.]|jgi:hypothetical protein|nr:MAG: hypothetical protein OJF51_003378 [Nitrospira sp.]
MDIYVYRALYGNSIAKGLPAPHASNYHSIRFLRRGDNIVYIQHCTVNGPSWTYADELPQKTTAIGIP